MLQLSAAGKVSTNNRQCRLSRQYLVQTACLRTVMELVLILLFLVGSCLADTFEDKTNTTLYCPLPNDWTDQVTIKPAKHIVSTESSKTGEKSFSLVYGSIVTVSCQRAGYTFNNKIVGIVGSDNVEYNINRDVAVTCTEKGELDPPIFGSDITTWCTAGCSVVDYGSAYNITSVNNPYPDTRDSNGPPVPAGIIVKKGENNRG
eukprot:sb/3470522/